MTGRKDDHLEGETSGVMSDAALDALLATVNAPLADDRLRTVILADYDAVRRRRSGWSIGGAVDAPRLFARRLAPAGAALVLAAAGFVSGLVSVNASAADPENEAAAYFAAALDEALGVGDSLWDV